MTKRTLILVTSKEMYWLISLLEDFIEAKANVKQLEVCYPLYQKLKSLNKKTKRKVRDED